MFVLLPAIQTELHFCPSYLDVKLQLAACFLQAQEWEVSHWLNGEKS